MNQTLSPDWKVEQSLPISIHITDALYNTLSYERLDIKDYIIDRYSSYAGGMCILVFSNAVTYYEEKLQYTTG